MVTIFADDLQHQTANTVQQTSDLDVLSDEELKLAVLKKRSFWKLDFCNIHSLPDTFFLVTSLKVLHLHGNNLLTLSPKIEALIELEILDVSSNNLREIPAEIGKLLKLKCFMAYNNKISMIPYSIGNLSNLETLSLSCNQLSFIPYDLGSCKSMFSLSLSHNRLTDIPQILQGLSQLKEVNLSQNKIVNLPELPVSLEIANLSGNLLTSLPYNINSLKNLKTLNLEGNRFSSVPSCLFSLPSLMTLQTAFNPLRDTIPVLVNSQTKKSSPSEIPRAASTPSIRRKKRTIGSNRSASFAPSEGVPAQESLASSRMDLPQNNELVPTDSTLTLVPPDEDFFREHDLGTVDKRDLIDGFMVMKKRTLEERLKFSFNVFDVNKDGLISKKEMENMLKTMAAVVKANSSKSVKALDQFVHNYVETAFYLHNKENTQGLSFEEFYQATKQDPEIIKFFTFQLQSKIM